MGNRKENSRIWAGWISLPMKVLPPYEHQLAQAVHVGVEPEHKSNPAHLVAPLSQAAPGLDRMGRARQRVVGNGEG